MFFNVRFCFLLNIICRQIRRKRGQQCNWVKLNGCSDGLMLIRNLCSILHNVLWFQSGSSNSLCCSYALFSNLGASLEDFHRYDSIRDLVPIWGKVSKETPIFGRLGHGDWIRPLMLRVSLCVLLSSQGLNIHIIWHFLSFPTVFELDDKQLADHGSTGNANTNGRLKGYFITLGIC